MGSGVAGAATLLAVAPAAGVLALLAVGTAGGITGLRHLLERMQDPALSERR
jgi:hypothetical protein